MNKLHVDSILKNFGEHRVLSDIYLSCSTGDVIGILGRNGSGKSTLLKIIFGSISAENAYVKINDKVYPDRFSRARKIAYLPQDSFIPLQIKVRTLLKLFSAENLSQHSLVQPILNQTLGELSGGEVRYLEILFILYSKADFIILDEPFNGLSPISKDKIKLEIQNASATKGIILTDHDYRNVLDVATKKLILINGKLVKVSSPEELQTYHYLPPQI